jgi:hypothetical protein
MHCRYPVFTLLLAIVLPIIVAAQGEKRNNFDRPVITLRTNPLSPLETDANVMLGVGVQWHPRWAACFEPAYIFARLYDADNGSGGNATAGATGFKLRTDVRYYFSDFQFGKRAAFFISPEFHYKNATIRKWDNFGINCVNGQCDFYQRARYKEVKNETGGLIKLGVNFRGFGPRMGFEMFAGLGAKYKDLRETGLPTGGSFVNPPTQSEFALIPREGWLFMLPGGVKLCYRIR